MTYTWKSVKSKLLIVTVVVVGLFFRLYPGLHQIIFPYDQARDVLTFQDMMARRHLALLGPPTDIPGVFHGPLFYDFFAPIYSLSGWDPWLPVLVLALLNLCSLFPLYLLMKEMALPKATKILAISFLLVSNELVSYARWISNPSLAVPFVAIFLLFLWRIWSGKKSSHVLLGLLLGLTIQLEVVLAYLVLLCYFALLKKRATLKQWMLFHMGVGIGVSPLILAELKFHFQATRALSGALFAGGSKISRFAVLFNSCKAYIVLAGTMFSNNVLALPITAGSIAFLALVIGIWFLIRRKKFLFRAQAQFLLMTIASSLVLILSGRAFGVFFFVGMGFALIFLASMLLTLIIQSRYRNIGIALACIMLASQIFLVFYQGAQHRSYVQVQSGVMFDQRMQVLDAIYTLVPPKTPFTISIFETPYGVRSAWAYYFSFYAQHHDVMIPKWFGFAANGYLGDAILSKVDAPEAIHIAVYEPAFSIPQQYEDAFTAEQNLHTTVHKTVTVNDHVIELRMRNN
jgi:hypothetical protein